MSRAVVGIDPGRKGGVAVIGSEPVAVHMPCVDGDIDGLALARILRVAEPALVVVEKAQAMPKQGVSGMFKYGMGFGKLLGVIEALEIPYQLVTPQAWKREVLAGTKKDKGAAINHARRRYPWADLMPGQCKKPQDGIADALCIAEFGTGRAGNHD